MQEPITLANDSRKMLERFYTTFSFTEDILNVHISLTARTR